MPDPTSSVSDDQSVIDRAIAYLRLCEEATSENRREALEDIRFRDGHQWPAEVQNSRQIEQRPCLTINKTDAYITSVENEQRQQRPRIKVDPTGGGATKKVSEVIQGLIRHIENNKGGGDLSYDTAFSLAATCGEGYLRVLPEYAREDAFEQELYLCPVENPFSVYFDPNSVWPDGSDGEECLITEMMGKHTFRRMYPGADDGANFNQHGTGDTYRTWINKEEIRIAEYYRMERVRHTLCQLSDGTTYWSDEPPPELPPGVVKVNERTSYRKQLHWWKLTALEVLEHKELPGKFIPVVPVYGKTTFVDGKRHRKGLVRNAKDPARMYNFWRTAMTESVALAPKAKWLMAEGQDEGHEREWATANISAFPYLRYKQTDTDGQPVATPPQRLQPEPPPQGVMVAAQSIGEDLSAVLGIVDPAVRIGGNQSGKALNAERQQSNNSTFNYYDNLTRSMAQTGRILLDLIPHYYSEPGRVVRIMGDDGSAKVLTLNQVNPSPGQNTPGPVEEVINDVTVGEYAVVMDTGPGYSTKRQEAVTAMLPLLGKNEQLMQVAGDLIFRNMDFPGADVIADRLAAANPLANIDELAADIPPAVQMRMKQQAAQIQQLTQQLQQAGMVIKDRRDIKQMEEEGETKRELMRVTAKAHDIEMRDATTRQDVETRAQTAMADMHMRTATTARDTVVKTEAAKEIEFIKGQFALMLAKIDERMADKAAEETTERAV
jgi:hypothetical protein